MNRVTNCEVENCIPTPSSCVTWNGGDIPFLGICNGDSLNTLTVEIVTKLQQLAGEDISTYDIDALLDLCGKKAPLDITLVSILNLIKDNLVCLKDFIDVLSEQLSALLSEKSIIINLKCYAEFDNLGNSLSITRQQLDQLIIDQLCAHEDRLDTLDGKVISLQSQIDAVNNTSTVDELDITTCVDLVSKPTSSQVKSVATSLCELKDVTGTGLEISIAWDQEPIVFGDANYLALPGWNPLPENFADHYSNLLIAFNYALTRITVMEDTCCALTCEDITLGFSALYNEDLTTILLHFSYGAGTSIPAGFTDKGSKGVITDVNGNTVSFTLEIENDSEEEISILGLNVNSPLTIDITAKLGTDALTCQSCLSRTIDKAGCGYCEICAEGAEDSTAVIIYESAVSGSLT